LVLRRFHLIKTIIFSGDLLALHEEEKNAHRNQIEGMGVEEELQFTLKKEEKSFSRKRKLP
jgi:hypothetical protein